MRLRPKNLVWAAESVRLSPLLPTAAVGLIAIFTVSLALAEPQGDSRQLLAARGDAADELATADSQLLTNDAVTENEAALFSTPLSPPRYHDRYRFYHRYDRHKARRSRFNTLDDGIN